MSATRLLRPPAADGLTGEVDLTIDDPLAQDIRYIDATDAVTINLPPCRTENVGSRFVFIPVQTGGSLTLNCKVGDIFVGNVSADVNSNGTIDIVSSNGSNTRLVLARPAEGNTVAVTMVSNTQWAIEGGVNRGAAFSTP